MGIRDILAVILDAAHRQVDRVFPHQSREDAYAKTQDFAAARPLLFTFILVQAALTLIPTLLFLTFAASILLLSLGAALLFTLFWTGAALLLLVPTLCLAGAAGICVWAWGLGCFVAGRWVLSLLRAVASASVGRYEEDREEEKEDREEAKDRDRTALARDSLQEAGIGARELAPVGPTLSPDPSWAGVEKEDDVKVEENK